VRKAISVFGTPSAASNTILARCANPAGADDDRLNDANFSRSLSRKPSGALRMRNYRKQSLSNNFRHADQGLLALHGRTASGKS
jgi:hypothetical protein